MTKDEENELITLSDLNREDNIKYISSEAQGIAIALDSDKYAPTFCKLERAYICGRRKNEKLIEELKKENTGLKSELTKKADTNHSLIEQMATLESENAELKKRIDNLYNSDCWASDQLAKAKEMLQTVFDKWKEERWILQSEKEVKQIENLMKQVEQFIKEIEKCQSQKKH